MNLIVRENYNTDAIYLQSGSTLWGLLHGLILLAVLLVLSPLNSFEEVSD